MGFAAAVLFGISAPAAKLLLDDIGPQLLAGLLYLGAFLAVAPIARFGPSRHEARLRRTDIPALTGLIVAGGIVAPVLLMVGLERVSGVTGSLLLNLEGPLTLIVGVAIEPHLDSDSVFERLLARATVVAPSFTIRGGTVEILRSVASRGLRTAKARA